MTTKSCYFIYCDGAGCDPNEEASAGVGSFRFGPSLTLRDYRHALQRNGWWSHKNSDYCPECAGNAKAMRLEGGE